MSFDIAEVGFYVVAFFVALIFVKMLIDKAKELRGDKKKKDDNEFD